VGKNEPGRVGRCRVRAACPRRRKGARRVGVGAASYPARRVRIERRGFATRKRRASGFLSSLWFFFSVALFLTCQTQKTTRRGRTARTGTNGKSGLVRLSTHTSLSLFFFCFCFFYFP
jgi:hypothetical protein